MLVTVPYVIVQVPGGIFDADGQTHFFYEGETVPTALEPYIVPSSNIVNPPLLALPSGAVLPTTLSENGGVVWFVKIPEDELYRWSTDAGAFVGVGDSGNGAIGYVSALINLTADVVHIESLTFSPKLVQVYEAGILQTGINVEISGNDVMILSADTQAVTVHAI